MSDVANIQNVNVTLIGGTSVGIGTTNVFAFWAPTAAVGGGITITRCSFTSNAAIAAASAPNFTLVTLGTNGATNGTIAAASGSAAFTAGTPRDCTVGTAFVDATYGVAVQWAQTAALVTNAVVNAAIQYIMGK